MPASFERWSSGEAADGDDAPASGLVVTRGFWVALGCWTLWIVVSLSLVV